MHRFQRVFRFLGYARENLDSYLAKDGIVLEGGYIRNTGDRSEQADASPLEIHFEENFSSVYGMNALRYLTREYGICDENGRNYFLDYLSEQRIRNMRSKKTALITIIRKLLERKNIAISSRNKIRVPCGGSSYFAFPKRIANLPVGLRMISNSILEKILRILWMTESKLKEKLSCMNIRLSACRRYKSAEMRVSRHFDCAAYSSGKIENCGRRFTDIRGRKTKVPWTDSGSGSQSFAGLGRKNKGFAARVKR